MVQPKWNQAESLILLDALLRVHDGQLTRSQAVQEVSGLLRQMAINQGQKINKTFRNINGISWQISIMEGALTGSGKTAGKAPRVFRDAVFLYRENPEEYEIRLQEAKKMAKLVPFEFEEAVLLLDALLRVRRREIKRSAALQELSAVLRERAIRNGREIDDSFRTSVGLSGRMNAMEQLMDSSDTGSSTALFRQVYTLYL